MCGLFVWSLKYELAVNETLRYVTCLSDLHDSGGYGYSNLFSM